MSLNLHHHYKQYHADVAKLVDALDLGSSAARHGGSSPSIRTLKGTLNSTVGGLFLLDVPN